jgi:protocatechuate 3,4-dioxygenase alpha subunit
MSGVGPRLLVRHRLARTRRDAVRGPCTNEQPPHAATPSQTAGPFFHMGLKPQPSHLAASARESERIRLPVRVINGDGQPVDDALIELWQVGSANVASFARMPTAADGTCEFETVRPAGSDRQAAHINICVFARGLLRQLHTRVYFAGDPALGDDLVLTLVPEDRRDTLLARPDGSETGPALSSCICRDRAKQCISTSEPSSRGGSGSEHRARRGAPRARRDD